MDLHDPRFNADMARQEFKELLWDIKNSKTTTENKIKATLLSMALTLKDVNEGGIWGIFEVVGIDTSDPANQVMISFWTTAYFKEGLIELLNFAPENSPIRFEANSNVLWTEDEIEEIRNAALENRATFVV